MNRKPNAMPWLIVPLALAAGGVAWYLWQQPRDSAPNTATSSAAPATPVAPTPVVRHPVEQAPAAVAPAEPIVPLPSLADSDAPLIEALSALTGDDKLLAMLRPQFVIQRVVATVDALPARKLAPQNLPIEPTGGRFATTQRDGSVVIAPENEARYARYLEVLRTSDPASTAALYLRFYPLFQQAYRELGYPEGYFNDRLVVVIDHLLAAPAAPDPFVLAQPKVMFTYADESLESRSAGEKIMMRIGNANAAAVRDWLRAFRGAITAAPPARIDGDAGATIPAPAESTPVPTD